MKKNFCLFVLFSFILSLVLAAGGLKEVNGGDPEQVVLPPPSAVETLGQADYNWIVRELNGREVAFSEFEDKVIFLHFWATWCPHCWKQLSSIQRLYERFGSNHEIAFVMASYEDQALVQKYISKKHLNLPVYLHEWEVPVAFGPSIRIPRTFIIDRKGRMVYTHVGAAMWDDASIAHFIRDLL